MQANACKRRLLGATTVCCRVGLLIGAELVVGLVLHSLTATALIQVRAALLSGQGQQRSWTLEDVVVDGAACLAWVAFAVLVAATVAPLLAVFATWPAGWVSGVERLGGPLWWRRAVLCTCGLGLVAPVAASASPAPYAPPHRTCTSHCTDPGGAVSLLAGLRLPDLPDTSQARPAGNRTRAVRPGDSLWLIARESLPPSASDPAIYRRVDAWYTANRVVIGADPDLIFPGTELTQPGGTSWH